MEKEYPDRLFHKTPSWVEDGSVFHIRIRCAVTNAVVLTQSGTAEALLKSAAFYDEKRRWFIRLFLLMPDHIHALISFPKDQIMSRVIADWKRYQNRQMGICWQGNFFDHRIRNAAEYFEKAAYIRNNPVVKGLCTASENWPWVIG
jgi:REP element-mobilizing transposase RayT